MSASRKSGYYWVKYVNQSHWSIEYWNGGMWFTRNSHLVEDSMFSTIDETPIVREQKETEQQSNCNLPHVSSLLIAWEQFKKANWWESDAIDVENVLIERFVAIYNC